MANAVTGNPITALGFPVTAPVRPVVTRWNFTTGLPHGKISPFTSDKAPDYVSKVMVSVKKVIKLHPYPLNFAHKTMASASKEGYGLLHGHEEAQNMNEIIQLDQVNRYNDLYGLTTLHPLVSVANLNEATRAVDNFRIRYGLYAIYLKMEKSCDIKYGRRDYDFQEGTIVCFAPGQTAEMTRTRPAHPQTNAYGLLFHPDLIRGTHLGRHIGEYSFFSYEIKEALHLSDSEREIFINYLNIIQGELKHAVDKHSKNLLSMHIEVLLGYCMRFYERQFTTRAVANTDAIARFESLLNDYFIGKQAVRNGLPTVNYFADRLCLSPNYFGDMLKKETGKSPQEYIQERLVYLAKDKLVNTQDSVSEIAYSLGFHYPQHFCRLFKRRVGCTPNTFRKQE